MATVSTPTAPAQTAAKRWTGGRVSRGAVVALVAGLLVWHASLRIPCGPAEGTSLAQPEFTRPATGETLRMATYNIHGGKGLDGVRDLGRIAEGLREMDVVGLQEAHGPFFLPKPDNAEELGRELRLGWLFAPSVRQWHHYDYGNGLLSRAAVKHWRRVPLERTTGNSYHNYLEAEVEHRGQTLHLIVTHIHRRDDRERQLQLRTVIERFLELPAPAVLMGDLNTRASDPQLAELLARPDVRDVLSGREVQAERIDWILTRGLRTCSAGTTEVGPSDHPMVWAEVEVER